MAKPVTGLTVFENNTTNSLVSLDLNFSGLANAINDPLSYSNYGVDIGAVNAISVVYTNYNFSSYQDGQTFYIKVANTNTSTAVTAALGGLTTKNVYQPSGTNLQIGQLVSGVIYPFTYNSALNSGAGGFQVSTPVVSVSHVQSVTINAVSDWGLDPTGVVDATTAIQNGFNALPTGSYIFVFFPPGIYTISGTITIPSGLLIQATTLGATGTHPFGGLTIYGGGKGVSIIQMASGVTASSFFNASAGSGQKGWRCIFRDLSMIALSTSYNAYHCYIINCAFSGLIRVSMHSPNTSAAAVAGIYFQGNIGGTVANQCYVIDSLIQGSSVVFDGVTDNMVIGSYVYAQSVSGGAGGRNFGIQCLNVSYDLKLTGCHIGCAPQGGLNFASSQVAMIATGCFFDTAAGHTGSEYGVYSSVAGTSNCSFVGNYFSNILASAIYATDPVNWTITGNNFNQVNSQNVAGAHTVNFITSSTGPLGCVVTGNTFTSANATVVYAISATSTGGYNIIGPNSVSGAGYNTYPTVAIPYSWPGPTGTGTDFIEGIQKGTYTPTLSTVAGGAPTGYTTQFGSYSKSGDTIMFTARVQITGTGTLSAGSGVTISLPFTTNSTANQYFSFAIGSNNLASTAAGEFSAAATNSVSYCVVNKYASGTSSPVVPADLTSSSVFTVTGQFRI